MKIGDKNYETLAVVDDQSNLLCVMNDKQVICVDKLQIIGEEEPGKLCFLPMENSATKCFVRQEGAVLPAGTMNAEAFFMSQKVQDAPVESEAEVEEKEEAEVKPHIETYDAKILSNQKIDLGALGSIADIVSKLPPETIGSLISAITAKKAEVTKSETAQSLENFEKQLKEEGR